MVAFDVSKTPAFQHHNCIADCAELLALPNFFFFVTTAYNILRHRGVPLGKRDFLGPVNWL